MDVVTGGLGEHFRANLSVSRHLQLMSLELRATTDMHWSASPYYG